MKKIICILLILLTGVLFVGCTEPAKEQGPTAAEVEAFWLEEWYELYAEYQKLEAIIIFYDQYLEDYKGFAKAEIQNETYDEIRSLLNQIVDLEERYEDRDKDADIMDDVLEYAIDKGWFTDDELTELNEYYQSLLR
jgi:hypothetical protein